MKNIALIFTLVVAALAFASCSQEDLLRGGQGDSREDDSRLITITASLPKGVTRGALKEDIDTCVVTIFNLNNPHPDETATFNPWQPAKVFTGENNNFSNPEILWPEENSPETGGEFGKKELLFYAHYPNLGEDTQYGNNSK